MGGRALSHPVRLLPLLGPGRSHITLTPCALCPPLLFLSLSTLRTPLAPANLVERSVTRGTQRATLEWGWRTSLPQTCHTTTPSWIKSPSGTSTTNPRSPRPTPIGCTSFLAQTGCLLARRHSLTTPSQTLVTPGSLCQRCWRQPISAGASTRAVRGGELCAAANPASRCPAAAADSLSAPRATHPRTHTRARRGQF